MERKFTDEKAARLALYGEAQRTTLVMGRTVLRPCIEPGCTEYAVGAGSRCAAHRRQAARKRWDQGLTGRRGSRGNWKRIRAKVIRDQRGVCALCGAKATSVHHVDGNARNDDRSNLLALCDTCHLNLDRIERRR